MYRWDAGDMQIELPEPTLEALDKFLSDKILSIFLTPEIKEVIRGN